MYWCYKWTLPQFKDQIRNARADDKPAATCQVMIAVVKLWQSGEAHIMPRMQDYGMAVLLDLTIDVHTTAEVLKLAYEGAPRGSALSRFAIDEARFEYFSKMEERLTEEDLESLAQYPGFLSDFIPPIRSALEDRENGGETRKFHAAFKNNSKRYELVST